MTSPATQRDPTSRLSIVIGYNIARLRGLARMSQTALALATPASRQTIMSIETGLRDPSIQMLAAIAAALGTTPDVLLVDPDGQPCFVCDDRPPIPFLCPECHRGG